MIFDAPILPGVLLQDSGASVIGMVIDAEQLEVAERLA
jgi:hypothetical protein